MSGMKCDYCGHAVAEDSAYVIGKAAVATSKYCWDKDTITTTFGQLTMVEKSTNPTDGNSYGELTQGTTFDAWRVYKLGWSGKGEGRFFKKSGHGDSYGEIAWNGPFVEVKAVPQSVVSYEYVDEEI